MYKLNGLASAVSAVVLLLSSTGTVNASSALTQINAEVEATAAQIDQEHGVLLTTQERINLKINLIVKEVAVDTTLTIKQKTEAAIETYEVVDPDEQRKLLIEIGAQTRSTGASSNEPP